MMQLSVIVPVYNVERYIEKCVLSVIQNGYSDDLYEIVIVDDESPDNSLAIIDKFKQSRNNIKVISQENRGLGGARNTGIRNASGKYLLFLDADDWYLPSTVEKLIQVADKEQLEILEFGAQGIFPGGEIMYTKSMNSEIMNGVDYYQKYRYLDSACNKLYNREFLINNDLFFLEKLYIEDYEFNTRALFKAKTMKAIDLITAQFLQSPDSITRNTDHSKHIKMQEDIILVIKKINAFYKDEVKFDSPKQASAYFEQKLAYLTVTLFYQLLKRNFPYKDIVLLRERLRKEDLFFADNVIFDRKKEWFRAIFLKHFFLLRLAKGLFRYI